MKKKKKIRKIEGTPHLDDAGQLLASFQCVNFRHRFCTPLSNFGIFGVFERFERSFLLATHWTKKSPPPSPFNPLSASGTDGGRRVEFRGERGEVQGQGQG